MPADQTMRAWRTHEYGARPTEVLQLDTVPIPVPDPGEVRVRVQAIPLNLNDLERINGGNMMVRPELPYSPGMEVMGLVDACGAGAEELDARREDHSRQIDVPLGRLEVRVPEDVAHGHRVEHACEQRSSGVSEVVESQRRQAGRVAGRDVATA